jgi:nucleoporin NUP1
MRDRWSKEPGSPRANRTSSLAPSSSMPPIRKGQLVWNSEKGFVRESELRSRKLPLPPSSSRS